MSEKQWMITGTPSPWRVEQLDRVVRRLARVDHERPAERLRQLDLRDERAAAGPRAARSRACSRGPPRRSRAPSGARTARAAPSRPASSKPSDSCGWRPDRHEDLLVLVGGRERVAAGVAGHADREHALDAGLARAA